MYTNKIGCTVYERTVGADRMEAYKRHFIPTIYWEDVRGQSATGNGMQQADSVYCCIPAASLSDFIPQPDDLIVCGRCEDDEPPKECRTIMSVDDFRYGSRAVQHLEVAAV